MRGLPGQSRRIFPGGFPRAARRVTFSRASGRRDVRYRLRAFARIGANQERPGRRGTGIPMVKEPVTRRPIQRRFLTVPGSRFPGLIRRLQPPLPVERRDGRSPVVVPGGGIGSARRMRVGA